MKALIGPLTAFAVAVSAVAIAAWHDIQIQPPPAHVLIIGATAIEFTTEKKCLSAAVQVRAANEAAGAALPLNCVEK